MSAPLTYVYCLVRAARPPSLRRAPSGMPGGGAIRALEAGTHLWLIASSVPEREYGETVLQKGLQRLDWVGQRAVAHEAVVEHFLSSSALVPMQLFTLFTSDRRAVEHVVRGRGRLARILARVEGQLEWGLRLTWDERSARDAVERRHERAGKAGGAGRAGGAGKAYLARKRDLLDVQRVQLKAARAQAHRLYRAMARQASRSRRRTATEQAAPGSRLLLDAAFLVPRRRAGAFRSELRRHARALAASGLAVSLTGPWPPYNFI